MHANVSLLKVINTFLIAAVSSLSAIEKPNVVVILADDMGLGDIGRQHTERTGNAPLAPTPNIDALANEGLWFTDAHSPASLCAPSRYAVMTGNYNYRSSKPGGVWGTFDLNAITSSDSTLGRVAQSVGYTTGFVGKWHLGGDFYATGTTNITRLVDDESTPAQVDMSTWISRGPQDLGFSYDFTVACGVQGPTYVAHENGVWYPWEAGSSLIYYNDPNFVADKGPGIGDSNWDSTELNMLLADKAAAFITSSAAGSAPFMLYYCSPAVHLPHTPPTSIDGDPIAGTTPSDHLDMNRVLDLEVKKIVDALKAAGEYENTLIIFTSDNGGLSDPDAETAGHKSNGGFIRGTKNSALEGGHRVPFIAVWPSVIPANTSSDSMINGSDILATIADVMGASFIDTEAKDSYSYFPLFLGNTTHEPRTEMMQQSGATANNEVMLRQGPWKLIIHSTVGHNLMNQGSTTAAALYNLDTDLKENTNLIDDPAQASRVTSMYNRYWELRNASARTAPSHGSLPNSTTTLFSEDFSSLTSGDSFGTNATISNVNYDSQMRTSNHAVGSITTNVSFGTGNVLQATTGTNANGGFGTISNADNPSSVSLSVGDEVTLSFDMLVQAVPSGTSSLNIQLKNNSNTVLATRTFTELSGASVNEVVSFSWTVVADSAMAGSSDIYFWIPIEGVANNFSTEGPNGTGTDLNVLQLDNINLSVAASTGYHKFKEDYSLTGASTGDDDGDTLSNALEYALGSNPVDSSSKQKVSTQIVENNGNRYMEIEYSRRKSANNYSAIRLWRTTDLSNPNWELGTTELISVSDDSNFAELENVVQRTAFTTEDEAKAFFIMDVVTAP